MITIKLCGNLGRIFPSLIQVAIASVEEAIWALKANYEGFEQYLIDAAHSQLGYRICVDGHEVEEWQLRAPLPDGCNITIAPIPRGAGNTFRIIAGIALLGLGIAGVGFLGLSSTTLMITGAALLLQSLRGRVKSPKDSERDGKRSLMFGGPQTTTQEGGRLSVAYGIVLGGWMLISQRISTSFFKQQIDTYGVAGGMYAVSWTAYNNGQFWTTGTEYNVPGPFRPVRSAYGSTSNSTPWDGIVGWDGIVDGNGASRYWVWGGIGYLGADGIVRPSSWTVITAINRTN